jgi:hypothetical protein
MSQDILIIKKSSSRTVLGLTLGAITIIVIGVLVWYNYYDVKHFFENIFESNHTDDINYNNDIGLFGRTKKEVFNIDQNVFTYDEAKVACKAFGAELATKAQVEEAQKQGANWCNAGWTQEQMALYPIQEEYIEAIKGTSQEGTCGEAGINGGYQSDKNMKFSANCYGKRPKPNQDYINYIDKLLVNSKGNDSLIQKYHDMYKEKELYVSPYSHMQWSEFSKYLSDYKLGDYFPRDDISTTTTSGYYSYNIENNNTNSNNKSSKNNSNNNNSSSNNNSKNNSNSSSNNNSNNSNSNSSSLENNVNNTGTSGNSNSSLASNSASFSYNSSSNNTSNVKGSNGTNGNNYTVIEDSSSPYSASNSIDNTGRVSASTSAANNNTTSASAANNNTTSASAANNNTTSASAANNNTSGSVVNNNTTSASAANNNTTSASAANNNTTSGSAANNNTTSGSAANNNTTSGSVVNNNTTSGSAANNNTTSGSVVNNNTTSGSVVNNNTTSGSVVNNNTTSGSVVNNNTTSGSASASVENEFICNVATLDDDMIMLMIGTFMYENPEEYSTDKLEIKSLGVVMYNDGDNLYVDTLANDNSMNMIIKLTYCGENILGNADENVKFSYSDDYSILTLHDLTDNIDIEFSRYTNDNSESVENGSSNNINANVNSSASIVSNVENNTEPYANIVGYYRSSSQKYFSITYTDDGKLEYYSFYAGDVKGYLIPTDEPNTFDFEKTSGISGESIYFADDFNTYTRNSKIYYRCEEEDCSDITI